VAQAFRQSAVPGGHDRQTARLRFLHNQPLTFLRSLGVRAARGGRRELGVLTNREREVLTLVAEGLTNAEIARSLVLGVETIRSHVSSALSKLGARDRTQAVVRAYQAGLIDLSGA
jgi:DNA-binding NarL/FixJ family response regulator